MKDLLLRMICLVAAPLLVAACGSNQPTGFTGLGDGGSDATVDGARGQDGGIHLLPDSGGTDGAPPCTGLACQVKDCGGGDTTVSGYVYAPNGLLPLYDVQVFIPNAPLEPFAKGVQCNNCGAPVSGSPITTALSDPTGHFILSKVPSGTNIPIVVQLGKWRRQTTLPMVNACTSNVLTDPDLTRLPKTQLEGSMPHIALTTGGCDQMGCMLPKVGIDPSEFGSQADGYSKAVNVYVGSNSDEGASTWTPAENLWGSPTGSLPSTGQGTLMTYDLAILSCECEEAPESKGTAGAPTFAWMTDYLNAGGRIFTTDFQYTWYKFSPDPMLGGGSTSIDTVGIGEIYGQAPPAGSPMTLVNSFPKGAALAQWLKFVYSGVKLPSGATYPLDANAQMGQVAPDVMYGNIQYLNVPQTVTWANSDFEEGFEDPPPPTGTTEPRVFTVDTPVGSPTAKQCGRGVHIDAHVDNDGEDTVDCPSPPSTCYPTGTCSTTLKPDEAMFAFFFFDLSSCIQNETEPPVPPPPVK
jgi:hypothetical protein